MQSHETELYHGGDLEAARHAYPQAPVPWLDLSTGINPWAYPLPALAETAWRRLPAAGALAALEAAAAEGYGAGRGARVVAGPGSQALIQLLPRLRPPGRVAVAGFTYREHERCWRLAGHRVARVETPALPPGELDVLVLVNPNNPDGRRLERARLLELADALAARDGLLVVDEAFADLQPESSLAGAAGRPGVCVLRSFGKFFGLAGMRLGFALCAPALGAALAAALGPWAVPGPAIEIGRRALNDGRWIAETRARLRAAAADLDARLAGAGLNVVGGTDLFRLVEDRRAPAIFETLCGHGILVRPFPERADWLRFGLPADAAAGERLSAALHAALQGAAGG